jgi:CubicO group peptidase (beta-lactamase class C family)
MTVLLHGENSPAFDPVVEVFRDILAAEPQAGAALAIRVDGESVVDVWGGIADRRDRSEWRRDTASVIFSCTKGLMSILAARLVADGRLDYDARVADYWPEFAQAGKHDVRVRHILAHQSGLSALRRDLTIDEVLDWDTVTGAIAGAAPLWNPGSGYAYHALTHGWLIGEVIRRVTGTDVGVWFAEDLAQPLNAAAWLGVPADQQVTVAHMEVGESLAALVRQQSAARDPETVDWPDRAMTLGAAFPPELVAFELGFNEPRVQAASIPGAGGIATARALAAIWSATVVETDGVLLLDPETRELATEVETEGAPVFDVPGPWPRWGMGFQLDSEARRYLGDTSLGHDGAGGQVAFADAHSRVGFAFLTNQMEAIDDFRGTRLVEALRQTLGSAATRRSVIA